MAAEDPEKRHKGSDVGKVDDIVTGFGFSKCTVLIQNDVAKMTEKAKQDQVREGVGTKPGTEESMWFMMRMCWDQISRNKYSAHEWPRWSKTWTILEVSRLAHWSDIQVVDFDMCRFDHTGKGPMRMIRNSTQGAQRKNRRCPGHQRHPAKNTSMRFQDRTSKSGRSRQNDCISAEARREEMSCFEARGVYRKVPYAQATERTGRRPIRI